MNINVNSEVASFSHDQFIIPASDMYQKQSWRVQFSQLFEEI